MPIKGKGLEDIAWFLPEGVEMPEENWNHDYAKSLGIFLNGQTIRHVGRKGEPIHDDSFYMIFNAHYEPVEYCLPPKRYGSKWIKVIDTSEDCISEDGIIFKNDAAITIASRSIVVLKSPYNEKKV